MLQALISNRKRVNRSEHWIKEKAKNRNNVGVEYDARIWGGQATNNYMWWSGQQQLFQPGQMVYADNVQSGLFGGGLGTAIGNLSVTSTTAIA